ncbi:hypothetical protein MY4824_006041 [Beauveria thailandica]
MKLQACSREDTDKGDSASSNLASLCIRSIVGDQWLNQLSADDSILRSSSLLIILRSFSLANSVSQKLTKGQTCAKECRFYLTVNGEMADSTTLTVNY